MSEAGPAEPFSAGFLTNPHPTYDVLRRADPVRPVVMPSGEQVWLVTRYQDVRQGLGDALLSNDQTRLKIVRPFATVPAEVETAITRDLLNVDPPDHARLRSLVADAFTAARAKEFQGPLERIAAGVLDQLGDSQAFDVIADFATPFATSATIELLGVPAGLREPFTAWGHQVATEIFKHRDDRLVRPVVDLLGFAWKVIEAKRAAPADDVLSVLVGAERAGRLSDDELTSMIQLLLVAAHEGPINLIGIGVFLLLSNPDQRARLQADPGLIGSAVEEFARYEAPLGLGNYRCAREPVTYSGVTIPAGEPILFSMLSAGRDEERFECPQRVDIGRGDRSHLGFGWGRHYCLGAPHGRIEAQVAIGSLLARYPELGLAIPAADVPWRSSVITRGLAELPVNARGGRRCQP
jgi:cytochrome P450